MGFAICDLRFAIARAVRVGSALADRLFAGSTLWPFRNPQSAIRNSLSRKSPIANRKFLLLPLLFLLLAGCFSSPNQENIELRKKIQALDVQIARLNDQHNADVARIQGLEHSATTVPVLPQSRLDEMFTVQGIRLGRLTAGYRSDPARAWDDGVRVYVEPFDETDDWIKASGGCTIEAFDLAKPDNQRIGRWVFSAAESKKSWYGFLVHSLVFPCPWQIPPEHASITVKVTFQDELTGRHFTQQAVATVTPPLPATTQAAQP